MADYSEAFAAEVRKALGDRSYRQVAVKAGLSASYIGDMVQGRIPSYQAAVAFADATGVDVARFLSAAGYRARGSDDALHECQAALNGAERLIEGFRELQRRYPDGDLAIPPIPQGGIRTLTVEEADAALAQLEREVREELGLPPQPDARA